MPAKLPTPVPPTQEFLAAQPVQSWWKRALNRLFAPESRWHRSRTGYGYSATWTTVSSDGMISQANRKVSPELGNLSESPTAAEQVKER